uniref:uncharacterized protein LOC128930501 n=1 Tax=Callithrix jacchus TaxID=9483 RepID=UPI0023DCF7E3|nr:uncharacterized protein LOC128930501 [Callithrix jacchus]
MSSKSVVPRWACCLRGGGSSSNFPMGSLGSAHNTASMGSCHSSVLNPPVTPQCCYDTQLLTMALLGWPLGRLCRHLPPAPQCCLHCPLTTPPGSCPRASAHTARSAQSLAQGLLSTSASGDPWRSLSCLLSPSPSLSQLFLSSGTRHCLKARWVFIYFLFFCPWGGNSQDSVLVQCPQHMAPAATLSTGPSCPCHRNGWWGCCTQPKCPLQTAVALPALAPPSLETLSQPHIWTRALGGHQASLVALSKPRFLMSTLQPAWHPLSTPDFLIFSGYKPNGSPGVISPSPPTADPGSPELETPRAQLFLTTTA